MATLAAEFPNDNPVLHGGAVWVCLDVTGPPAVELPPRVEGPAASASASASPSAASASALEPEADEAYDDDPIVVEDLQPLGELDEIVESTNSPAPNTPDPPPADARPQACLRSRADAGDPYGFSENASMFAIEREELAAGAAVEASAARPSVAAVADPLAPAAESGEVLAAAAGDPCVFSENASMLAIETEERSAVAESSGVSESSGASGIVLKGPDDSFTAFVSAAAAVAIGAGSPFVASLVPVLLIEGRAPADLSDEARALLAEGGIVDGDRVSTTFAATAEAWQGILAGTSEDWDAIGSSTLDEWAADWMARLLGSLERRPALKRDLRARGVAAFGLVEAA